MREILAIGITILIAGCIGSLTPEETVRQLGIDFQNGNFESMKIYTAGDYLTLAEKCSSHSEGQTCRVDLFDISVISSSENGNESQVIVNVTYSKDNTTIHYHDFIAKLKFEEGIWKIYTIDVPDNQRAYPAFIAQQEARAMVPDERGIPNTLVQSVTVNSVTVLNSGTATIGTDKLQLYFDDKLISCKWSTDTLNPGQSSTCLFTEKCEDGQFVTVRSSELGRYDGMRCSSKLQPT